MWYMVYGTGLHVGTVCLLIQTTAAVYRLYVSFRFLMELLSKIQLFTTEGPKRNESLFLKKS